MSVLDVMLCARLREGLTVCFICDMREQGIDPEQQLDVNKENLLRVLASAANVLNTAGSELAQCPTEYGPVWLEALDILGQNLMSLSMVLAADAHAVGGAMAKETLRIRMSN